MMSEDNDQPRHTPPELDGISLAEAHAAFDEGRLFRALVAGRVRARHLVKPSPLIQIYESMSHLNRAPEYRWISKGEWSHARVHWTDGEMELPTNVRRGIVIERRDLIAEFGETTFDEETRLERGKSAPVRKRSATKRDRAKFIIDALYPDGVQPSITDAELIKAVGDKAERDGFPPPSRDTTLRAAGRRFERS